MFLRFLGNNIVAKSFFIHKKSYTIFEVRNLYNINIFIEKDGNVTKVQNLNKKQKKEMLEKALSAFYKQKVRINYN